MQIIYTGPHRAVEIADTGLMAENGKPIEVPDDLAAGLLEQPDNWTRNETKAQREARLKSEDAQADAAAHEEKIAAEAAAKAVDEHRAAQAKAQAIAEAESAEEQAAADKAAAEAVEKIRADRAKKGGK